ncbi:hypothetical protein TorRG33x02_165790 [Trema orientale]|uniref:Uncharacterized protein n=1 Tax=Trema orientale TaxID=63057 RepID=A0A2P5EPY8_TREOI|nr:hypothetical protein TorRG33x02_165790 [Trema orientale]
MENGGRRVLRFSTVYDDDFGSWWQWRRLGLRFLTVAVTLILDGAGGDFNSLVEADFSTSLFLSSPFLRF